MEKSKNVPSSYECFSRAINNYSKVYDFWASTHANKKYKYLPSWILRKSNYLINEKKSYKGNKKVYSRGAIVFVDFGINIGTELSGNHFAIVLNKKDSMYNDKLTVVPLTSKKHKGLLRLDESISKKSREKLIQHLSSLLLIPMVILMNNGYKSGNAEKTKRFLNQSAEKVFSDSNNQSSAEMLKQLKIFFNSMKSEEITEKYLESFQKSSLNNKFKHSLKMNDIYYSFFDVKDLMEHYEKYDKISYARVKDITTISKARIKKRGIYDPTGIIKVSGGTLDQINKNIEELFLKY